MAYNNDVTKMKALIERYIELCETLNNYDNHSRVIILGDIVYTLIALLSQLHFFVQEPDEPAILTFLCETQTMSIIFAWACTKRYVTQALEKLGTICVETEKNYDKGIEYYNKALDAAKERGSARNQYTIRCFKIIQQTNQKKLQCSTIVSPANYHA